MRMEGNHSNVSLPKSSNLICTFLLLLSFLICKISDWNFISIDSVVLSGPKWCLSFIKWVHIFKKSIKGENGCLTVVPVHYFFQEYCLLSRVCRTNLRFDRGNNVVYQNQHFDLSMKILQACYYEYEQISINAYVVKIISWLLLKCSNISSAGSMIRSRSVDEAPVDRTEKWTVLPVLPFLLCSCEG